MNETNQNYQDLIRKMHAVSYSLLEEIDQYCKDNHILYFLSGGSCLGAIRHKGFIPWDDDIDIMLPRPDYEKFLIGFAGLNPKRYMVGSLYTDPEWKRPASRIWDMRTVLTQTKYNERQMGVFIDVFPIDGLPANGIVRWIHYRKVRVLNFIRNCCIREGFYEEEKHVFLKKAFGSVFYGSDARKVAEKLDQAVKKYDFYKSKYVGAILAIHYWDRETIERKYMDREVRMPFENGEFPVPIGYEQYLRNLYGDYMKIPQDAAEKGYSHLEAWRVEINNEGGNEE